MNPKLRPSSSALALCLVAGGALAQAPLTIAWDKPVYQPYEPMKLTETGQPGLMSVLGLDMEGGPVFIPGLGLVHLGFSSAFAILPLPNLPPTGTRTLTFTAPCPCDVPVRTIYTQAVGFDVPTSTVLLSNPASFKIADPAWTCSAGVCTTIGEISSSFNGTKIDPGNLIWFNSVVKVNGIGDNGWVRFKNQHITFQANSTSYDITVPDTLIVFSSIATVPTTIYNWNNNLRVTQVPNGFSGELFLSGVAAQFLVGLPGGINPVTWTGTYSSSKAGSSFRWKWGAAVYTQFGLDQNALGVTATNSSPENFKAYTTGGARGGGAANTTGSWSATKTPGCQ
jgi:hypothetical protein